MKIIHGDGFTNEELRSYKPTICDNLVHSMRAVLEAMGPLHINLGNHQVSLTSAWVVASTLAAINPGCDVDGTCLLRLSGVLQDNRVHAKAVLSYVELGAAGGLTPELTAALKALWGDTGVQVGMTRATGMAWQAYPIRTD